MNILLVYPEFPDTFWSFKHALKFVRKRASMPPLGLLTVATMLLLAPQSGKKTRAQIQRKSIELRDQTTEAVEDAVAQASVKARQITADVHEQAEALQQRGQDMLDEQKKRLSTVVKAGKSVTRSFS